MPDWALRQAFSGWKLTNGRPEATNLQLATTLMRSTALLLPPSYLALPAAPCSVFHSAFKFFKIFFANGSLISECRGTASVTPFFGLIQSECDLPSRFR